jgi:pyruvate-formate lyase-activating enzyme
MYCPRPFEQFYVVENGDVHLCCPEWIAMPAGNVLATPPLDIWRGRVAQNIRKSIVDGSFRHCINCPFLPGPAGCVDGGPPTPPELDRIHTLTIAYDPSCNLRCASCRAGAKTASPRAERVQDILLESGIFGHVDRLCSSGSGDPLASSLYWELLERLPASHHPKLRLILQTNGLLLTPQGWDKLGEYANRVEEVLVSVDACGPETYRQNRGGDWEILMQNLVGVVKRGVPLQLNFVVQSNNFREMPGFAMLASSLGARRTYFSTLEHWDDTYGEDDYLRRAVHLPSHPEHGELLEILHHPVLRDSSRVTLARLPAPPEEA